MTSQWDWVVRIRITLGGENTYRQARHRARRAARFICYLKKQKTDRAFSPPGGGGGGDGDGGVGGGVGYDRSQPLLVDVCAVG